MTIKNLVENIKIILILGVCGGGLTCASTADRQEDGSAGDWLAAGRGDTT